MNIANFKVSTRLNFGFGLITLGTLLVATISIVTLNRINNSVDYMVNQSFAKARLVTEWRESTKLNGTRLVLLQNGANPSLKESIEQKMHETSSRISDIQKVLNSMPKTVDEQVQYQEISKKREKYLGARDTLLAMKKNLNAEDSSTTEAVLENALQVYLSSIEELGTIQTNEIKAIEGNIQTQLMENQITLGVLSFLVLTVGVYFGYVIKKSVIDPLKQAIRVTKNVSLGHMSLDFNITGNNEISELLQGLKNMTENLSVIMQKVRSGTEIIVAKSSQMAAGSVELSTRTVEQASSLDETSITMKSIMKTVKQNSDHANEANKLAVIASDVAIKGGIAVSEAVDTMGKINESSKKIADISGVIDGIAFQTNILALNAAVEAARAGEQGRGFAVVASEVRSLAQRSAAAAKEIKMLIEESVVTVDMGEKQIHHTGTTMEEIVVSIKKVSNIVKEIASASLEQSNGIEQIDIAISQLDRMTQQNANLVEESLSSIQSLEEQTTGLMAVVGN